MRFKDNSRLLFSSLFCATELAFEPETNSCLQVTQVLIILYFPHHVFLSQLSVETLFSYIFGSFCAPFLL